MSYLKYSPWHQKSNADGSAHNASAGVFPEFYSIVRHFQTGNQEAYEKAGQMIAALADPLTSGGDATGSPSHEITLN